MKQTSIKYRNAQSEDTENIVAFHGNEAMTTWEKEFLGYKKESGVLFLAEDEDNIIGTQGLIPYPMNVDGTACLATRSERTLVSPKYRGKNIFGDLYDYCRQFGMEKNSQFVFGSTGAFKAFKRIGFRHETGYGLHMALAHNPTSIMSCIRSGTMLVSLRLKELIRTIKQKDKTRGVEYAKLATAILSLMIQSFTSFMEKQKVAGLQIESMPYDFNDIKDLYSLLRGNNHLIYIDQDERFWKWRHMLSAPPTSYYAYLKNKLVAYLIYDSTQPATTTIVDFSASDTRSFRQILYKMIQTSKSEGKAFVEVSFNAKCHPLRRLLPLFLGCGFIPVYLGGNQVLLPLQNNFPEAFSDIKNFYITDLWHILK